MVSVLSCQAKPFVDGQAFIETALSEASPYPFQQVIYSIKIFTQHPLVRVGMQPPNIDETALNQLGNVQQYRTTRHGKSYYVAQVDYLFFSKHSGKRTISAPIMNGVIKSDDDPYSTFGLQEVSAKAPATTLQVRPIPSAFKGDLWLPTPKLTITDDWSTDLSQVKVGESVTRTIILHAQGVTESQLPDITFPEIAGVSIYPDKPEAKMSVEEGGVSATKVFKFAVVPTQTGTRSIPELKIPWWNTKTQRMSFATIEGADIRVVGAPTINVPAPPNTVVAPPSANLSDEGAINNIRTWQWWALMLLAISGWLVAIAMWWQRGIRMAQSSCEQETSPQASALSKRLKTACDQHNAQEAYNIALQMARLKWPDIALFNLCDVCEIADDPGFAQEVEKLTQLKYAGKDARWDGMAFYRCFLNACQSKKTTIKQAKTYGLPQLYPKTMT